MFTKRSIYLVILSAMLALVSLQPGCSSGSKPTEMHAEMPTEYPKTAAPILQKLSGNVPANVQVLGFGSYGSIVDAIPVIKGYRLVKEEEVDNVLKDLGTHYLLNPAKLKDYYKAGLDTGSGFAVGTFEHNMFMVFDILDTQDFRRWLDNFINEEFGRPRYHEGTEGDITFVEIKVLQKDFATLILEKDRPAILVIGDDLIPQSDPSLQVAKSIVSSPKLSETSDIFAKIHSSLTDAPFAVWMNPDIVSPDVFPSNLKQVLPWISGLTLQMQFMPSSLRLNADAKWRDDAYGEMKRGQFVRQLIRDENAGYADVIMKSSPSSAVRLQFDAKSVEAAALPFLTQKQQDSYADLKGKLTQRLIKLNFEQQIVHNIGAVWAALYDSSGTVPNTSPSVLDILTSRSAALYIPFIKMDESNAFFAKVNVLTRFVSADMLKVEMEESLLHATISLKDMTLHAGYRQGLLAVSTERGWETVRGVLLDDEPSEAPSVFSDNNHFLASDIKVSDITNILGLKYAIVKEQLNRFLDRFDSIQIQSSATENNIELLLQTQIKP